MMQALRGIANSLDKARQPVDIAQRCRQPAPLYGTHRIERRVLDITHVLLSSAILYPIE